MTPRSVLALLVFVTASLGQASASADEESLPTPERIVQTLNTGVDDQKRSMAERLLLKEPRWRRAAAREDLVCTEFDSVKLEYAVLRAPGPQAVLLVDCTSAHWLVFLVLLEKRSQTSWHRLQTALLWGKYRPPAVSFESLINTTEKEIVVHGYEVSAGTGWWQYNMLVLKLFGERLETVFDEPEVINYSVPTTGNDEATSTDQHQESKFKIVRSEERDDGHPAVNDILELQTIRDHDAKLVRCKLHFWIPALRRFQSTPTACEGNWFPLSPE